MIEEKEIKHEITKKKQRKTQNIKLLKTHRIYLDVIIVTNSKSGIKKKVN